jgi:hypothetical protein
MVSTVVVKDVSLVVTGQEVVAAGLHPSHRLR